MPDCAFDPLVVVRTSSEGRMLSKWLDAARKRLGGTFPRDAARAEKWRRTPRRCGGKLKGGKQAVAGVVEDETRPLRGSRSVWSALVAGVDHARWSLPGHALPGGRRIFDPSSRLPLDDGAKKLRDDCEEWL